MFEHKLVLFHSDTAYAKRFAAYLEKKSGLAVSCAFFADEKELWAYLEKRDCFLLIGQAGFDTDKARDKGIAYLIMTEAEESRQPIEMPRYRSMEKQIRQIRPYMKHSRSPGTETVRCRILGFYSPVHGAGQSVSALLAGLCLAEDAPTLLLNLERYSGLNAWLPFEGGGLSDLMYYARVTRDPLEHLSELTEYYGPLALVPPVREVGDFEEISPKDWAFLLEQLGESGLYRYILLDIGDGIGRPEELLKYCHRIYVPLREDELALAKFEAWQRDIEREEPEALLPRLRPYRLPPEAPQGWVDHRQLKLMPWGRCIKALAEAEL